MAFSPRTQQLRASISRPKLVPRATSKNPAGSSGGKAQEDLQDLLIDPAYDPLFDGVDEDSGYTSGQDPFQGPKLGNSGNSGQQRGRQGRPVGSARVTLNKEESSEDYLDRLRTEKEREEFEESDIAFMFDNGQSREEEEAFSTPFEYHLKIMRQTFLEKQQEEVMELHHKYRASEVSSYAQATALASLMDYYERQDESSEDLDPLPSWIRAKKAIALNWENVMEKLAGSRTETIKNLREFSTLTEERQRLLDTWDDSLYEGVKDAVEVKADRMDQFLMLSDSATPTEPVVDSPTAEDWSKGIMPDFDDDMEADDQ